MRARTPPDYACPARPSARCPRAPKYAPALQLEFCDLDAGGGRPLQRMLRCSSGGAGPRRPVLCSWVAQTRVEGVRRGVNTRDGGQNCAELSVTG
jgi:hypothetical protein